MPKLKELYSHYGTDYVSKSDTIVQREGQQYYTHFVIQHSANKVLHHGFICGFCGEYSEAVRLRASSIEDKPGEEDEEGIRFIESSLILTDATKNYFNNRNAKEIIAFHCKCCDQYAPAYDVAAINQRDKDVRNAAIVWADTYDDGHLVKLKWIMREATAWQNKLQIQHVKYTVVANIQTGQTYFIAPKLDNGKRPKWYKGADINCITYSSENIETSRSFLSVPDAFKKQFYELVHAKVTERLGYRPLTIEEHIQIDEQERAKERNKNAPTGRHVVVIPQPQAFRDTYRLENISLLNRFPNLNPLHIVEILRDGRKDKIMYDVDGKIMSQETWSETDWEVKEKFRGKVKELHKRSMDKRIASIKPNDPNAVGTLMKNFKVPMGKSFRKLIMKDNSKVLVVSTITRHFKEIDNIRRILEAKVYKRGLNAREMIGPLDWNVDYGYDTFMKDMISRFGETVWTNKILDGHVDYNYIRDTASMYYKIMKRKKPELEVSLRGNLREMHDRFSEILDNLDHPNEILTYTDLQRSLEYKFSNGHYIRLAQDTRELRHVGRTMHICVGGYADRALRKSCNIALMLDDKDQYVMCIELSGDFIDVCQAKLHCNNLPDGDTKDMVTEWIIANKLYVQTWDLGNELREERRRPSGKRSWLIEEEAVTEAPEFNLLDEIEIDVPQPANQIRVPNMGNDVVQEQIEFGQDPIEIRPIRLNVENQPEPAWNHQYEDLEIEEPELQVAGN